MQLDSATFDVGALGYGHAVPVLLELIHAHRRADSHAFFPLVNDFAAWLRAQYLAEPTHERQQPEGLKCGWPLDRVQRQLELLSPTERQVYEQIGDKPKNQRQILNLLKKAYPEDFNESSELYRTLGTLKKCLLIKAIADGYVRLTST